jgi:hypothetical protein
VNAGAWSFLMKGRFPPNNFELDKQVFPPVFPFLRRRDTGPEDAHYSYQIATGAHRHPAGESAHPGQEKV